MKPKLLFFLAYTPLLSMCQTITINGTVGNEEGQPVPMATVTLKRTGVTTFTNSKGAFTIPNTTLFDTIIVSAVGYQTAVEANNERGLISVTLKKAAQELSEVIINSGFQKLPKERATGSFTQISNSLFNQQVSTNLLDRLEAITNALSVDKKTLQGGISIRGLSTIRGPRAPLIILDNFPFEGDLGNINPNDVENITILKDAAAASIWGTRAGNGVIVITTRSARFNQPLKLELNVNASVAPKPDLLSLPQINTSDFIDVEQFLYSKGYYNNQLNNTNRPALSPVIELLIQKTNGQLTEQQATAAIDALRSVDYRKQLLQYMYRPAVNRQYAATIRAGAQNFNWLFSIGYDQNTSDLHTNSNRLTLRSENTFRPSKKLQFTLSAFYTNTNSELGRPGYGSIIAANGSIFPYAQLADAEGNPLPLIRDYRKTYIDTAGAGRLLNWQYVPLEDYKYTRLAATGQNLLGKIAVSYKITNGLSFDGLLQYAVQENNSSNQYNVQSYFARNLINQFAQINRTTGVVTYRLPLGGILDQSRTAIGSVQGRAQLSYAASFKKHNINAIAGSEIRQVKSSGNSYRLYGYDEETLTTVNTDLANTYPHFITGRASFIPSNQSLSETVNRFVSFFTNMVYTYNQKYTASFSARKDASNLFGVNTNDKWTPLWSAGLSWEISAEKFYRLKQLPWLKLRATYGLSGNIDPSMAAVVTLTYGAASPYTQTPFAFVRNFFNPELKWETTAMFNIALDFKTINERISGSVEWYLKKGNDLIGPSPLDYTTGLGVQLINRNISEMKGNGFDLELNTINTNGKIKWLTQFNFNYNTDEVTKYYRTNKQGSNFVGAGLGTTALEGKPVYGLYSYQWAGLDPATGNPQGFINGQPSTDYAALRGAQVLVTDLAYNGPVLPVFFGSMGNTLVWKKLSLTARISWKLGHYYRKESISYGNLYSTWKGHPDFARRWQQPGDERFTNVPSMPYPAVAARDDFYLNSAILVAKADHIRLQFINLTYDVLNKSRGKKAFDKLQLYVNVQNIGIIWKATNENIDPDYPSGSLPPTTVYATGIRASF